MQSSYIAVSRVVLAGLCLISCEAPDQYLGPDAGTPPDAETTDAAPQLKEIHAVIEFEMVREQYGVTCSTTDVGLIDVVFSDLSTSPHFYDVPCNKPEIQDYTLSLDCAVQVYSDYLGWKEIRYLNLSRGWDGWSGQFDTVVDGSSYFWCVLQYKVWSAELIWETP